MDRQQKIRFLKELVSSCREIKNQDNPELTKLFDNFQRGLMSKNNIDGLDVDLSDEEFDEVIKESPWVVDSIFDMVEGFNTNEQVDFGHEENFTMSNLYQGIQDLMSKYKEYEDEQKDF